MRLPTRFLIPAAAVLAGMLVAQPAAAQKAVALGIQVSTAAGPPAVTWLPIKGALQYTVERWRPDAPDCCRNSSGRLVTASWTDAPLPKPGVYLYRVTVQLTDGSLGYDDFKFNSGAVSGAAAAGAVGAASGGGAAAGGAAGGAGAAGAAGGASGAATGAASGGGAAAGGSPSSASPAGGAGKAGVAGATGAAGGAAAGAGPASGATAGGGGKAGVAGGAGAAGGAAGGAAAGAPSAGGAASGGGPAGAAAAGATGTAGAAAAAGAASGAGAAGGAAGAGGKGALANPTGFSAIQLSAGAVRLFWQPVPGASGYLLLGPGLPRSGLTVTGATSFTVGKAPMGAQRWLVGSLAADGSSSPTTAFSTVDLFVGKPD